MTVNCDHIRLRLNGAHVRIPMRAESLNLVSTKANIWACHGKGRIEKALFAKRAVISTQREEMVFIINVFIAVWKYKF